LNAGVVYRRCGCRGDDRRQLGRSCPLLAEDPSHGRWYFAVQVDGIDGRRTRVRKGGFSCERDARRAVAEFGALPGPETAAQMWTVGRWLRFWLAELERSGGLRPTTLAGYRQVVDCYLIPEFDRLRLSKLRIKQVQRGLDRISRRTTRSGRTIEASTVHGIRSVLRSALSTPRRRGLVAFNAAWRRRTPDRCASACGGVTPAREDVWRRTGIRPRVAC